jgi:simple sugar transport system permease protein
VGPDPELAADRNLINIINAGSVYYLSGLAVAIGFRMNLFNIGVDGQYRLSASSLP